MGPRFSECGLFSCVRNDVLLSQETAVRKSYSKSVQLLYKIRIFGRKYVNRTVVGAIYCMFYVLEVYTQKNPPDERFTGGIYFMNSRKLSSLKDTRRCPWQLTFLRPSQGLRLLRPLPHRRLRKRLRVWSSLIR